MLHKPCRCGSALNYTDCCQPYHTGLQTPLTAEALMRSRFTAFALRDAGYLLQTWDESTRPSTLDLNDDPSEWQALVIVKTHAGKATDLNGQVEFKAYCTLQGQRYILHESSRFIKRLDRWFYVDGVIKANGRVPETIVPAKNAPCPCSSGKKYKRCCGAG